MSLHLRPGLCALALLGLSACGLSGVPGSIHAPDSSGAAADSALHCAPVVLPVNRGVFAALETPPGVYDWQTGWQSCEVQFTSRTHGSQLYGVLFAPQNIDLQHARLPAVVISPGSITGLQTQYHWSARELAGHGYIVLTVDPQGQGNSAMVGQPQTADNHVDGIASALDFLLSPDNPLFANVDAERIGGAGHSLSARAMAWLQGEDSRIKAIVAWDNLSSTLAGDAGVSSGGGAAGVIIGGELPGGDPRPVTQRVPAMGQASDKAGGTTQDMDPEVKKTAFNTWRDAGVASMQIVFRDRAHLDWAQSGLDDGEQGGSKSRELQRFQYYTRAWFDLWLKNDKKTLDALTAPVILGEPMETIYSQQFRSALYLPEMAIDCPDIAANTCAEFKR